MTTRLSLRGLTRRCVRGDLLTVRFVVVLRVTGLGLHASGGEYCLDDRWTWSSDETGPTAETQFRDAMNRATDAWPWDVVTGSRDKLLAALEASREQIRQYRRW